MIERGFEQHEVGFDQQQMRLYQFITEALPYYRGDLAPCHLVWVCPRMIYIYIHTYIHIYIYIHPKIPLEHVRSDDNLLEFRGTLFPAVESLL